MSNIYVTKKGTAVTKDGGQIVITYLQDKVQRLPIDYVENLVILASTQVSYDALMAIMQAGGSVLYLNRDGHVVGEIGSNNINQRLLVRQLEAYANPLMRLHLAKDFVKKKLEAQKLVIMKYNKQLHLRELQQGMGKLLGLLVSLSRQTTVKKIMGIEGIAAKTYFDVFGNYLLRNSDFVWQGRKKHPAPDPLNAMLSFAYSLLEKDVRRVISVAGLNSSIGYLHSLDLRKDSLVYDLMEPFRPLIVDKLVLRCVNLKMLKGEDFLVSRNSCLFNTEARNKFILEYEKCAGSYEDETSLRYQIRVAVNDLKKELLKNEKTILENLAEEEETYAELDKNR